MTRLFLILKPLFFFLNTYTVHVKQWAKDSISCRFFFFSLCMSVSSKRSRRRRSCRPSFVILHAIFKNKNKKRPASGYRNRPPPPFSYNYNSILPKQKKKINKCLLLIYLWCFIYMWSMTTTFFFHIQTFSLLLLITGTLIATMARSSFIFMSCYKSAKRWRKTDRHLTE